MYNEAENYFFDVPETTIELEHCLVALSKWESKWHKPFLTKDEKTREEFIDYVGCMCLNESVDPMIFYAMNDQQVEKILKYIDDPMTATSVNNIHQKKGGRGQIVTSELIYYWMNEGNISMSCETWHLNRLFKLIEITSINRQPDKKMSKRDVMNQNRALNAARRAKYGSRG